MKKLIYLLLALIAVACGSNQQVENDSRNIANRLLATEFYATFTKSEFCNDTLAIQDYLKREAESLDSCYLIHYDQPINGYDIRMKVDSVWTTFSDVVCKANFIISNGDKTIAIPQTYISFTDSIFNSLKKFSINELDYNFDMRSYYSGLKYPHFGNYGDMPFLFFDTNFDHEKELVTRVSGVGQRGRSCYYSIKLDWNDTCKWEWADYTELANNNIISESRFDLFDDMTQFDYANNTFILHISARWWENEWLYYKMEKGEYNLVKKIVEYFDNGEPKVKRVTYYGNKTTETEIPLNKDGSYLID